MKRQGQPNMSTAVPNGRLNMGRVSEFVDVVNERLEGAPYIPSDDPHAATKLLRRYFVSVDPQDDFLHRLGRNAERYLWGIAQPMRDRVPEPLTDQDVVRLVAHTVANSINSRRRGSAQKSEESEVSPD